MIDPEGFAFKQEPFEQWYRDGAALFAEHLRAVGEPPDAYTRKNIKLMRLLDELGVMQITTARTNGRMVGYLQALICPSLEDEQIQEAIHTTFFCSPDAPGLGLRLIRASIDALRARGIRHAMFRAGTRGNGARMGALYRRVGAENFGQLYRLDLEGKSKWG